MQIHVSTPPPTTPFERFVMERLTAIEKNTIAGSKPPEPTPLEKLLQPKQICEMYGITRATLEKFFKMDLLTQVRFTAESRKVYVRESQLREVFKTTPKC